MMHFFRDNNKKTIEWMFAIKLLFNTTSITDEELFALLKRLKKFSAGHFKSCQHTFRADLGGGIIFEKDQHRHIVIDPNFLEYREKENFSRKEFNDICLNLYDFYSNEKKVEPEQIKLIGRVFQFEFDIDENALDFLKRNFNLFKDKTTSSVEIRTSIVENQKNIHLQLFAGDKDPNLVFVKLDINNRNQEDGLAEDAYNNIMSFADEYNKDKLLPLLNSYLS